MVRREGVVKNLNCSLLKWHQLRCNLDTEPVIETIPIKDYKRGLSKIGQIHLAVAMELVEKEFNARYKNPNE